MTEQIVCSQCRCTISGESFFDRFFKKRVCRPCWDKNFKQAQSQALGEWFEANYDVSAYSRSFWDSVAAFIKLPSNTDLTNR